MWGQKAAVATPPEATEEVITMFNDYPDIVTVDHIIEMLGLGKSTVYSLLKTHQIRHVRVGAKYIVPKQAVIDFVSGVCYNDDQIISGRLIDQSSKGAPL